MQNSLDELSDEIAMNDKSATKHLAALEEITWTPEKYSQDSQVSQAASIMATSATILGKPT